MAIRHQLNLKWLCWLTSNELVKEDKESLSGLVLLSSWVDGLRVFHEATCVNNQLQSASIMPVADDTRVTLAISTCKRLPHFIKTITAIEKHCLNHNLLSVFHEVALDFLLHLIYLGFNCG